VVDFELRRANPPGSSESLHKEAIWAAVTTARRLAPDQAAHQIGSGSLSVRDEEGRFSFIHQSVMEWLIAQRIASEARFVGATLRRALLAGARLVRADLANADLADAF
jgi:uncharacterized protein YjbI with pentapeptide repeats